MHLRASNPNHSIMTLGDNQEFTLSMDVTPPHHMTLPLPVTMGGKGGMGGMGMGGMGMGGGAQKQRKAFEIRRDRDEWIVDKGCVAAGGGVEVEMEVGVRCR